MAVPGTRLQPGRLGLVLLLVLVLVPVLVPGLVLRLVVCLAAVVPAASVVPAGFVLPAGEVVALRAAATGPYRCLRSRRGNAGRRARGLGRDHPGDAEGAGDSHRDEPDAQSPDEPEMGVPLCRGVTCHASRVRADPEDAL